MTMETAIFSTPPKGEWQRYYRMLGVKPRGLDRFENRFGESLGPPEVQVALQGRVKQRMCAMLP